MRESSALLGLLLAAALLISSACTAGTMAGPPVSDALRQDAKAHAEAQGIPLEEAIRRLRLSIPRNGREYGDVTT